MSGFFSAYHGTVLLLSINEFEIFKKNYDKLHPEPVMLGDVDNKTICEEPLIPAYMSEEEIAKMTSEEALYMVYIDDENEGLRFTPYRINGQYNSYCADAVWNGTAVIAVFAEHQPDSPIAYKPGYHHQTYDELEMEFKRKLDKYLPDTFDWETHIGLFSYAAYA